MTSEFVEGMAFWAQEFDRRLTAHAARRIKPSRASKITRALEQVGQPLELDLLGIDPKIAEMELEIEQLDDERVLKIADGLDGLPSEVLAWGAIRGFRVRGALLDVDSGLAFSGARVISQSGTGHRWVRDAAFITGALRRVKGARTSQLEGDVAWLGVNPNYYHLLVESLPRLLRLRDLVPGIRFASNSAAPDLLREIDSDLADRVVVLDEETVLSAERLWMVTPQPLFAPHPSDLDYLHARYSEADESREPNMNILISRGRNQRLPGVEESLTQELRARDFRVTDFTTMRWSSQVEVVSSARTLVGVHGAGLSNLVFMPPGGRVIEISDGEWWFPCYRRMAGARGLAYSLVVVNSLETTDRGALVDAVLEQASDD